MSAVATAAPDRAQHQRRDFAIAGVLMLALIAAAPFFVYPFFVMEMLCVALFACAFNLLIGYVGLLSFGQAAFFGMGSYVAAWVMKAWHVDASIAITASTCQTFRVHAVT